MKKYLIKGLLALVVGGFTASCADKDGDYVPVGQQKATAYADAFKELIGGEVAPNHDWGFTKTSIVSETAQARANTRGGSDPNTAIWPDYGYPTKPGELKATTPSGKSEEQIVTEWFQSHTIADAVTLDCNNYWVLQVHYKDYNYTVNQHEFEKYENGQEVWKTATTTVNPKGHMDQIYANKDANSTSYDHIYNFNTSSGSFMLVRDSETKYGFGYEESWGTSEKHVWYNSFMAHIVDEANGIDGYYVGFDYQTYKDKDVSYQYWDGTQTISGTTTNWALNPDGVYDDRIIKIVPGTAAHEITPGGETSSSSTSTRTDLIERRRLVSQGRVFCEDLGTSAERMTKSDIDFNDAVFDAKIWRLGQYKVTYVNGNYSSETDYLEGIYDNGLENGKFKYIAEIRLLAAGGTVQLKIGGDKGFEIHEKFGEGNNKTIGHTTIINTMGAPSQANFSTTVSTETCDAVTVEVDITSLVAGKSEIGLDIIPIDVLWVSQTGQSVGELNSEYGQAPQKLCVPIGTPWVYERIPITTAYKDFDKYAKEYSPSNPLTFWDPVKNTIDTDYLYANGPEGMTPETGETGKVDKNPYHDTVVTEGTTTTTTVTETVLWEGEFKAQSNNGTTSEVFTLYSNDLAVGDVLRVYGEAKGNDAELTIQAAENGTVSVASCTVRSPYTDIVVTQDIINKLTKKVTFWGRNCIVTKLSKVVTTTN